MFSVREVDPMTQTVDVWFTIARTQDMNGRKVYARLPSDQVVVLIYKYWKQIQDRVGMWRYKTPMYPFGPF